MKILRILLIIMAFNSTVQAFRANFASTNTISVAITVDTLLTLSPQAPKWLVQEVQEWLVSHPKLTEYLSGAKNLQNHMRSGGPIIAGTPEKRNQYFLKAKSEFAKAGYPTLSPSVNWIIHINDDVLIKASGEPNRHENINSFLGQKYGSQITVKQLKKFNKEIGVTYQTISRIAYGMRAQEVIEQENLSIKIPPMSLVHIPGRPKKLADINYVVAEEYILGKLEYLEDSAFAVDKKTILDLTKLIGFTGLWSLGKNIMVSDNKDIYFVDLEQPNVHSPKDFFHKNAAIHRSNVEHGWGKLEGGIIKPYAEKNNIDATELLNEMHALQDEIRATWK
jgi:hypothetical protein